MTFTVPGPPVAKERPRFSKGRVYTPKATRDYERKVGLSARAAGARPTSKPVSLCVTFAVPRGKRRPDLDNLVKSIEDGLNGVAWFDDSQVVELHAFMVVRSQGHDARVTIDEV